MSAVFTQHAVERMRQMDVSQSDLAHFLDAVERVANNPGDLGRSGDVVRVRRLHSDDDFIVRAGDMRAVVTVDPAMPERLVVVSVYRTGETEQEQSAFRSNDHHAVKAE